jgi:SAM-dependent methyltransferase
MTTRQHHLPGAEELEERRVDYDRLHAACDTADFHARFWTPAVGEEHPVEVEPSSSCTWSLLGEILHRLRLRPDELLVDLGCGRGGTGLWLARAFSARLIGLDVSPLGVRISRRRAPDFLPEGRAEFRESSFEQTGLPDAGADGVVSMDALPFAFDRDAALAEVRRILRPGARAVFTASSKLPGHPGYEPGEETRWQERIERSGLEVEEVVDRPDVPFFWQRLYEHWLEHEAELRAAVGDDAAEPMLDEARTGLPLIPHKSVALYVMRHPVEETS